MNNACGLEGLKHSGDNGVFLFGSRTSTPHIAPRWRLRKQPSVSVWVAVEAVLLLLLELQGR